MGILLGFDPGGKKSFGWAVVEGRDDRLILRASGAADHAEGAVRQALSNAVAHQVSGVGIDSPMYWTPTADRVADQIVRRRISDLGAPSPGGTVQHINSLRGACVVQGILCALLLRRELPAVPVTEAHPKALLWLLGIANRSLMPEAIHVSELPDLDSAVMISRPSEHERDAVLGAMTAAGMLDQSGRWENLMLHDKTTIDPVPQPLGYWMPRGAARKALG